LTFFATSKGNRLNELINTFFNTGPKRFGWHAENHLPMSSLNLDHLNREKQYFLLELFFDKQNVLCVYLGKSDCFYYRPKVFLDILKQLDM
jgi:hypothetical protein